MGFTYHCIVKAHKEAGRAAKDDEISMEEFLHLARSLLEKQQTKCMNIKLVVPFCIFFVIGGRSFEGSNL